MKNLINAEVGKKAGMVLVNLVSIGVLNVVGNQVNQQTRTLSNNLGNGAKRSMEDKWRDMQDKRKNK